MASKSKDKLDIRFIFTRDQREKTPQKELQGLDKQSDMPKLPDPRPEYPPESVRTEGEGSGDNNRYINTIDKEEIKRPRNRRYSREWNLMQTELIIQSVRLTFFMILIVLGAVWIINATKHSRFDRSKDTTTKPPNYKKKIPVIVWYTDKFPKQQITCYQKLKPINCKIYGKYHKPTRIDAYLFLGETMNFSQLPLPRNRSTLWGLISKSSPINALELLAPNTLSLFNFTATFSRHSTIPFPLKDLANHEDMLSSLYFVKASMKTASTAAPVVYIESDCKTLTGRDEYVKELMKYISVDSYGTCLNNKVLPPFDIYVKYGELNVSATEPARLRFLSNYKFMIAIEEAVCDDYSTTRVWEALTIGVIPIYYGSPRIKDFLPTNKSVIFVEDFASPKDLSDYLRELMADDEKYDEYRTHKSDVQTAVNKYLMDEVSSRPYETDFLESMDLFICYTCKKLHRSPVEQSIETLIANRSHYNCSEPLPLLNLRNPTAENPYANLTAEAIERANKLYDKMVRNDFNYTLESLPVDKNKTSDKK